MNFLKRSPKVSGPLPDERSAGDRNDTAWAMASAQYENTFLRLGAQVANWRMFAFFCLILSFGAVGGMAYVGSKSKFVPMVMEVDRLGQVVAVKALHGDEAITDPKRHAYAQMFELIENLRTVTTDRKGNNALIEKGFSRLTGSARTYARVELRKNPPNEVGATKTVQPIVRTALPLGGKTWQIDWEERSFNLQGEEMGVEFWRATVQVMMNPSEDEKIFRRNPAGFYVTEMSWQKVIK